MDRGYGEIGDGSDISAAPVINAAAHMKGFVRATSRSLTLLVNSTVRLQPEQWIRACIAEPRLLGIRLLTDATSPFNQGCGVFTRSPAFSPARAALHSQSNAASLSSCAAGDGAMGWRL